MKSMSRGEKCVWATLLAGALAFLVACASGCSTLDHAYRQEVTWTNAPMVQVFTNTVVVTNTVPVVTERTNVVFVTNAVSGAISGYAVREAVHLTHPPGNRAPMPGRKRIDSLVP